jgi:hypothetical protein
LDLRRKLLKLLDDCSERNIVPIGRTSRLGGWWYKLHQLLGVFYYYSTAPKRILFRIRGDVSTSFTTNIDFSNKIDEGIFSQVS